MISRKKAAVGLYFSAHWCGLPCVPPQLAAMCERLRERRRRLNGWVEVIFVSSDRSRRVRDVATEHAVLARGARADADGRRALAEHFGVRGIPHFAVLDADLNVVNGGLVAVARDAASRVPGSRRW